MDEEYFIDDTAEDSEIKDLTGKESDESTLDLSETQYVATDFAGSSAGTSGGSYGSADSFPPQDSITIPSHIVEAGAKAAYIALQDVWNPIAKTGTHESGKDNDGTIGRPGHTVRDMQRIAGGYVGGSHWCACAVTLWWKLAGLEVPNGGPCVPNRWGVPAAGAPFVPRWVKWAQEKNLWSKTPAVGAAVIFGSDNHHIGIVVQIDAKSGTTVCVEGNYHDFPNGGVYKTTYPRGSYQIHGFVIPGNLTKTK